MDKIHWWRTTFGRPEVDRISEAVANENISLGEVTQAFESQLARRLGTEHAVATTSGSTALLVALESLGIGEGDEVIVPNRTWIATAHAIQRVGAKPVLVDVRSDLPILDEANIEDALTPRTRAILPVHLNGRGVDMRRVTELAEKHDLVVVEDASQALFSKGDSGMLGTLSHAGAFSLSVAKLISTGQGGFVVTDDEEVANRARRIRRHGVTDVLHPEFTTPGFNYRITDIQSAIGLKQLERAPGRIDRLKEVYRRYEKGLSDVEALNLLPVRLREGEVPLYVEVLCEDRGNVVETLAEHGIETRPFYPDLHTAPHIPANGSYPNSERFGKEGLFLPCGPDQAIENVDRVLSVLEQVG